MKKYLKQFKKNMAVIEKYYTALIKIIKENKYVGIVNEWLVDNFFQIVEKRNIINTFLENQVNRRNIIIYGERLYKMTEQIFRQYDFKIDYRNIIRNISKYQSNFKESLNYTEISLLQPIMILVTLSEISNLCRRESKRLHERMEATKLISKLSDAEVANLNLYNLIRSEKDIVERSMYVEHIYYELNKKGNIAKKIFVQLNEVLDKHKLSLRSIITNAHKENVKEQLLVVDVFSLLKLVSSVEQELFIEELSLTEKMLKFDADYEGMNVQTKVLYRNKLLQYCKKNKIKEIDAAKIIVEKGKKEEKHIGFYLIKNPNYEKRFTLYLISVIFATFLFCSFVASFFSYFFPLVFFLILVPTSEIVIQIINRFLSGIFRPQILPKMDYSKGIPDDKKTMIVITTIIKDKKKIDEMFVQLEKYFLTNKDKNLFFTLLADCAQSERAILDNDYEIANYGIKKCEQLREKYGLPNFFYAYRKRHYNTGENAYLGYERKRGGILHLNKLLLKTFSDEEKEKNFFAENLSSFQGQIKYVITLDIDSQLILELARGLVGTMAHPLNQPIIDEKKNKVISGFAILQPKISVDVESSNKSVYAKLYGSVGGFDVYNPVISNFYQDLFGEGSFMGKGIYDLEVFQKILEERFPDNLILSHDLLESNYLRSGFISDIEIVDGFPSKFLTDMTRQHRWIRGDTQILSYLGRKVKNRKGEKVENPISALGKWKIFDNIRRIFIDLSLCGILIFAFLSHSNLFWLCLAFVIVVIALPIIFYLAEQARYKFRLEQSLNLKPYRNIVIGFKAVAYRTLITFVTMPYKAYLFMNAFFKSLYRLLISKKNLLNWLTAEEAEKTTKNNLASFISNFKPNYFFYLLILALTFIFNFTPTGIAISIVMGALFLIAPFLTYFVSKDSKEFEEDLKTSEKEQLKELAYKTWKFFEDNLTLENNFLIPDNFQSNREYKLDDKTSPTNIAYSITSVISAWKFKFISKKQALFLLNEIISSVEELQKWNGHLYNWYNIKTFEVLYPQFVSSVDSGNFVASLFVLKSFLENEDSSFVNRVERLIAETNFSVLYNKDEVFSVGFNTLEGELSPYCYNNFASEARLLSYVAIVKGDVPSKHWFCLNKSLIRFKNKKGLASWAGSLFEYYMPSLFIKNIPNTLLDEACDFAYFCQKSYIEEYSKDMPWGISECAYDELDNGINYKYKVFSVPYLKFQEEINPRIVISPYSSLMVLQDKPKAVFNNLKKFQSMQMLGKYGLFESYDYSTDSPIFAYFAHHQGMIFASLTNYLKNDLIHKLFDKNVNVKAYEILIKEKIQIRPTIDIKIEKYKKFNYSKEIIENDIRYYTYISAMPEISALSNSTYTVFLNDRGNGYSKYGNIQLNRYRLVTEQNYGVFLYLKDVNNNQFWSNTYAPVNVKPEKYEVVFASDRIKYVLTQNNIIATTEIIVTPNHSAEIRRVTLKNMSMDEREIELTTYLEPTIIENLKDVSHRSFNSLFLSSEYDYTINGLIMRRNLINSRNNYYMLHKLFIKNPVFSENEFEIIKGNFVGEGKSLAEPAVMNRRLTCSILPPLDPIMSIRNRVKIPKLSGVTIYIINAFGSSRDQILQIANSYDSPSKIENVFQLSSIINKSHTKLLNITGRDMRIFNSMLNYLFQSSKYSAISERKLLMEANALSQESLWKFGISGDKPIILVTIGDISSFSLVREVLKAFEYFKTKGIYVDIVIVNNESDKYDDYIEKEIKLEIYRMNALHKFSSHSGNVYVLDGDSLSKQEIVLLNCVASLSLDSYRNKSLGEFIEAIQSNNRPIDYHAPSPQKLLFFEPNIENLTFFNGFGGFDNDGKEYVIVNQSTKVPWSNVIANENFGTVVTNTGCGFTYAYNSQIFKLTSWTNDTTSIDQSEGIKINNEFFIPQTATHGFGWSKFWAKTKHFDQELTEFVAKDLNAKIFLFKINNTSNIEKRINITFWINPVLGDLEEKTSRYLLSSFNKENNYLEIRNGHTRYFPHTKAFLFSSEKANPVIDSNLLVKSIEVCVNLQSGEEKEIVFVLGVGENSKEILNITSSINNAENAKKELKKVKANWEKRLSPIVIKTPDKSFNYLLNGWLLYQTLSSRIMAKAGFYQVSGAFGFRDQLQDATNISCIEPEITKNQIIENAKHQFLQGDVLHWWIEKNMFGLRSRYKDDALWLIFATSEYIIKTNDFSILNEQIPFIEGEKLKPHEDDKGIEYYYTDNKKSLFEHLKIIIENSINDFGKHNLPKMGGGDWNDGMNKIGNKGKGESVWLGFFLYDALGRFIEIIKKLEKMNFSSAINEQSNFEQLSNNYVDDLDVYIKKYEKVRLQLFKDLNFHGWDGNYYLRAYYDNGAKVGSSESDECKIDLISQSFSILTGVADKKRTQSVLNAVENYLVDKEHKIVKLLTPPFKNSQYYPGYIMDYPQGIRENGGQYTHSVAWYVMALLKAGENEKAFEIFQMINPINRTSTYEDVITYRTEPYVIAADIYSGKNIEGRGGWTWYTGSSGWFYKVGIEEILGIKKIGNVLTIKPNIYKWKEFEFDYRYKNTLYKISVIFGNVDSITLDRKKVEEIKLIDDEKEHKVIVQIKNTKI